MPALHPPFDLINANPATLHGAAVLDYAGDIVSSTFAPTKSEAISAFTGLPTVAQRGEPGRQASRARKWKKATRRGYRVASVVLAAHHLHFDLVGIASWAAELVRLHRPDLVPVLDKRPETPLAARAVRAVLQDLVRATQARQRESPALFYEESAHPDDELTMWIRHPDGERLLLGAVPATADDAETEARRVREAIDAVARKGYAV